MKKKHIALLCSLISVVSILTATAVLPLSAAVFPQQEEWFATAEYYAETYQGFDQDGLYGNQCVDLVFNYAAHIFPIDYYGEAISGNADQLHDWADPRYFEVIPYSDEEAERGDVLIYAYGPGSGYNGHAAIVSEVYEGGMEVVHQHINGRRYVEFSHCPDFLLWNYAVPDYILRPIDPAYIVEDPAEKVGKKTLPVPKTVQRRNWLQAIQARTH